jgi:predicted dehydrogenase
MRASHSLNRRSFLKTSCLAGAGFALIGTTAADVAKPVRLGFIGTGSRGTGLLQTLLLFPQVEIRAVCDLMRDRATNAARLAEQKLDKFPEVYADTESIWKKLVQRDDLDAVIIATPWDWHARMAVAAMRAGKYPGVEVPAALTLEECWELVRTSERTGIPCMMLENVCYFRNVMALLRMVREGLFGDVLHCEAGYQHDCRFLAFTPDGKLTWRGEHAAKFNGNLYPTHPVGPAAQWMNINRGDRFVSLTSVSTASHGLQEYAAKKFGPGHPLAKRDYAQGDLNTTLLRTANGRTVTLYYDTSSPRPYYLILRLQGRKGIYLGSKDSIYLETADKVSENWEAFEPYQQKYEHPLWQAFAADAARSGGHGGAEYLMFHDFLKAVRRKAAAPQDVYDAAVWSAIVPLSLASVARGGKQVVFPDFTGGRWQKRAPLPVYGP